MQQRLHRVKQGFLNLMQFGRAGQQHDLAAVINEFGDGLYAFLRSQTDQATADDVYQMTWLRVIEKRANYQEQGYAKAWLYTVARNALIDQFRQQQRWTELADEPPQAEIATQRLVDAEITEALHRALAQLSLVQREAWVLQEEGFSIAEIAQITGTVAETVKTRLRYAKQQLQQQLAPWYEAHQQPEMRTTATASFASPVPANRSGEQHD